jgi:hypothetical protein
MSLSYTSASITCDRYEDHGRKTTLLRMMLSEEMLVACRLSGMTRHYCVDSHGVSSGTGDAKGGGSGDGIDNREGNGVGGSYAYSYSNGNGFGCCDGTPDGNGAGSARSTGNGASA